MVCLQTTMTVPVNGTTRFGPNSFSEVLKLSGRADESTIDWGKFRYMVYDIPTHKGTYQERYALLGIVSLRTLCDKPTPSFVTENLVDSKPWKYIRLAPAEVCRDERHLEAFFQDILDRGGEGIILRDPYEPLYPGRAPGYLKHKVCLILPSVP